MMTMITLEHETLLTDDDLGDIASLAAAGVARVQDTLALLELVYHLATAYGSAMRRMEARQVRAREVLTVRGKVTKQALQQAIELALKELET
jgi:hypothetical protein